MRQAMVAGLILALGLAGAARAMDDGAFQAALATGDRADLSRPQRQFAFDTLLKDRSLTSAQKAEVYWRRAVFQMGEGSNIPQAINDYRASQALNPGDSRLGPALTYAQSQYGTVNARLDGEAPDQRADDLYQLGRWKDAYALWKQMAIIGVYPSEPDVKHMIDDKVMCPATSPSKTVIPTEDSYGHGALMVCTL